MQIEMTQLREALESSWDEKTSYKQAIQSNNPALGQCYPTSRVTQLFFPDIEIIQGEVWTGESLETHFWNLLIKDGEEYHIDFTWQQFPVGSIIRNWTLRDRENLQDGQATIDRVDLLYSRVLAYFKARKSLIIQNKANSSEQ